MTAFVLVIGAVLIAIIHVLPRGRPGRPITAVAFGVIGFLGIEAAASRLMQAGDRVSPGELASLVNYSADYDGDLPVVLLVGSSLTRYGIDAKLLSELLAKGGHKVRVSPLALDAMSHLERLLYLRHYLARTKKLPQFVFFEIAQYYDERPLAQLLQSPYSDRMVEMMDGENTWLALEWLASNGPPDFVDRAELAGQILGHFALHVLHAGLARESGPQPPGVYPRPGIKTEHFSDAQVAQWIDGAMAMERRGALPEPVPSRWMRDVLDREMGLLRARGVDRFGFYFVPSSTGHEYLYARQFCRTVTEPCIIGDDPELLQSLKHDADWYNLNHLNGDGRRRYTEWLADRMLAEAQLP